MDKAAPFLPEEIIEPTLHFTTTEMKISEGYPMEKLPISELVKTNQILLRYDSAQESPEDIGKQRPVIAGPNTRFSEDCTELAALTTGYPLANFVNAEKGELKALNVSVEPLFQLSKDLMTASMVIKPLLFNYNILSSEDIYQLLTKSDINHGVDYKQLNVAKTCIKNKSLEDEKIVVANGNKPVAGRDAHLQFQLEIGPIAGMLLENGRIDFRERKIMVPVYKDQKIAVKMPPTQGKPGKTVLGTRIAPKKGNDIEIETAGGALFYPEDSLVIATEDGVLSVVNNNTIKVTSKLEISGDIDYSTGNIESGNCVVVKGSVLPGFLVKTAGDLEIKGSIMSTRVSSLANVVVKGGITGNVSQVTSAGDTDINFIEQGEIRCQGNCVIRKQSYYSNIYSGGSICCHEDSKIVGGEFIAEGNIVTGTVGAPESEPILLAAGVSTQRLFHYRKLIERLDDFKNSIPQRLKEFKGVTRKKKLASLKDGLEEMELRSLRINMIPGTGLFSKPLQNQETDDTALLKHDEDPPGKETDISKITVDVHKTIFKGTIIQIGNCSLTVAETTSGRRFFLDDSQKHIIAVPIST